MAFPLLLPLLFGAAVLAVGKKKSSKKSGASGRPQLDTLEAHAIKTLQWNEEVAREAQAQIAVRWEESNKMMGVGSFFVIMRDTAMEIWPNVKWPLTVNDEMRTVSLPPGRYVPAWIHNLGEAGPVAERIWWNLREIVWDIAGYTPPV